MTNPSKVLDDIRSVGLSRAEAGSFLITGRPRIRSAWLAALLANDEISVYHEAPHAKQPITDAVYGLLDPGAACLYPNLALEAFEGRTIIIIERPEKDARASLERLINATAGNWSAIEDRYQLFKSRALELGAITVPYSTLEDYEVISNIVALCTGADLSRQRFELMLGLHVEQDFLRAREREQAAA